MPYVQSLYSLYADVVSPSAGGGRRPPPVGYAEAAAVRWPAPPRDGAGQGLAELLDDVVGAVLRERPEGAVAVLRTLQVHLTASLQIREFTAAVGPLLRSDPRGAAPSRVSAASDRLASLCASPTAARLCKAQHVLRTCTAAMRAGCVGAEAAVARLAAVLMLQGGVIGDEDGAAVIVAAASAVSRDPLASAQLLRVAALHARTAAGAASLARAGCVEAATAALRSPLRRGGGAEARECGVAVLELLLRLAAADAVSAAAAMGDAGPAGPLAGELQRESSSAHKSLACLVALCGDARMRELSVAAGVIGAASAALESAVSAERRRWFGHGSAEVVRTAPPLLALVCGGEDAHSARCRAAFVAGGGARAAVSLLSAPRDAPVHTAAGLQLLASLCSCADAETRAEVAARCDAIPAAVPGAVEAAALDALRVMKWLVQDRCLLPRCRPAAARCVRAAEQQWPESAAVRKAAAGVVQVLQTCCPSRC
eukprot:TRINITY_DN6177_c6_g1_i1.p1 TRINITY_DN6177_c6_g1~~TRINITY_DN6177_c6_g1_i1.p1  ORF type:complete len:484 (+),score=170.31 TRINITY_DN6177_c6_g1_i1:67-1518(+)